MNIILFLIQTIIVIYIYFVLIKKNSTKKIIITLVILFLISFVLLFLASVSYAYINKLLHQLNSKEIYNYYFIGFFLSYVFIISFCLMMYVAFYMIDIMFSPQEQISTLLEIKQKIKQYLPYILFCLTEFIIFATWFIR